jgi:hypothetical protein
VIDPNALNFAFHATDQSLAIFEEEMIGNTHDPKSALGFAVTTSLREAIASAEVLTAVSGGDPTVVLVNLSGDRVTSLPADDFHGPKSGDGPLVDPATFSGLRRRLVAEGISRIEFTGDPSGGGVVIDPAAIEAYVWMDLPFAKHLVDALPPTIGDMHPSDVIRIIDDVGHRLDLDGDSLPNATDHDWIRGI